MKNIQIDLTHIKNVPELRAAFDSAMSYPNWYDESLDEWIDLVSVFDHSDHNISLFNSQEDEHFILELSGSVALSSRKPGLFRIAVQHLANVNMRYMERLNKPIVSVTFS
jgi:hypothetical protein